MNEIPIDVKIAVLESYVGEGLQIKDIAKKHNVSRQFICYLINGYFNKLKTLNSLKSGNPYDFNKNLTEYTAKNLTIYAKKTI